MASEDLTPPLPRRKLDWVNVLTIAIVAPAVIALLAFVYIAVDNSRHKSGNATRVKSKNNLKQISLGIHGFNDVYSKLPTPYAQPPGGASLLSDPSKRLSWRVSLLPFIDEVRLYNEMRLDEAWDGPTNGPLALTRVNIYSDPARSGPPDNLTPYRVFVGGGAMFDDEKPARKIEEITDGTSHTIMTIEAAQTVPWAQYNELPFDANAPLPPLGAPFRDVILVGMADGSVREVKKSVDPRVLKAAITASGGEALPADW